MQEQQISQNPKSEFPAPVKAKSGKGKKILLAMLALLLTGGVAYGAYWYGQEQVRKENEAKVAELQAQIDALKNNSEGLQSDETLGELATASDGTDSYSVNYPASWNARTVKKTVEITSGKIKVEDVVVTSPSGEVSVNLSTGISGLGGACLEEESGKISTLQIKGMPRFGGHAFMYYSSSDSGTGVSYSAAVVNESTTKKAKVGGSVCDVYLAQYLDLENSRGATSFTVNSKSLDALMKAQKSPTSEQVAKFFESDEFSVATKIMQTLKES